VGAGSGAGAGAGAGAGVVAVSGAGAGAWLRAAPPLWRLLRPNGALELYELPWPMLCALAVVKWKYPDFELVLALARARLCCFGWREGALAPLPSSSSSSLWSCVAALDSGNVPG
tara:strand:- start:471 stop:815 length:345 start_codon:yes stop_codon:yes gene_type:complete